MPSACLHNTLTLNNVPKARPYGLSAYGILQQPVSANASEQGVAGALKVGERVEDVGQGGH